jgi:hypothetical protein
LALKDNALQRREMEMKMKMEDFSEDFYSGDSLKSEDM